ncbi:MAG: signal peptidase I [Sandaracinaceae bacterium]|nr:signal peptidase I [Sandaracinaceae bacterium]
MRDFTKGALKFLGVVAVILLAVGAVLYFFFVRVVTVGHNAMAPTVMLGDQILVWRTQDFELGEMVLCPHPSEANRYVLGRVVGRAGQTISIERGNLHINGQVPDHDQHDPIRWTDMESGRIRTMRWATEDILSHEHYTFVEEGRRLPDTRPHQVRGGAYLMSDNRSYIGEDSRTFGEVSEVSCIGRAFMRLTAAENPAEIGNSALDILE